MRGSAAGKKKKPAAHKKKQTALKPRLSPAELRTISREISAEFPQAVDDASSRLVLLDVDPKRLHAYWNIPLRHYTKALNKSGIAKKTLRFYLLPADTAPLSRALYSFDVEVQGLRNQQYIDLQQDNALYAAECGITAPDGRFVSLVRSNVVRTPPAGQSPDRSFKTIDTFAVKNPPLSVRITSPQETTSAQGIMRKQLTVSAASRSGNRLQQQASRSAGIAPELHSLALPKQDVLLDEAFIDALIKQRLQTDTARLFSSEAQQPHEKQFEAAASGTLPSESISSSSLYSFEGEHPSFTAELVIEGRIRPGVQLALHGSKVPVSMDGRFQVRQLLPKDAGLLKNLAAMAQEEEQLSPPATPELILLTAEGSKEELQFEIYASLHVYGKIINNEALPFFTKEMPVRPDGSFYLTRILPRGALLLPELMVSLCPGEG